MMDTDATAPTAGTDMAIVVVVGVAAAVGQDTDGCGIIAAATAATIRKTWIT